MSFLVSILNTLLLIRGVEVTDNTSEKDLFRNYNKIRHNLCLSNIVDFAAVSVKILPSFNKITNKGRRSAKIQVVLPTVSAKRQFLQIRRTKKDIDIVQKSRKPLLITEELTRKNQELFYAARSLRESHKFKFVWSNNAVKFSYGHSPRRM